MDEIAVLAAAAAVTVVTAMATDAWSGVRTAVVGLFRRSRLREATARIETELDDDASLVASATEPDAARRALIGRWAVEFSCLLQEEAASREALARMVNAYQADVAEDRRPFIASQANVAFDYASVYGVQHGDLHVHQPHPTGASERKPDPDAT